MTPVPQDPGLLTVLVRATLGRKAADPDTAAEPEPPVESAEPAGVADASAPAFDSGVVDLLADKVLFAWLRNRYQLLFPFALDLRRLNRSEAELLVGAMVAAAHADGTLDAKERSRIEGALSVVELDEASRTALAASLEQPKPLNEVLRDVRDARTGALVYAASLLSVDQSNPVNRHYLRYLAARLQLSEELVGSLEQRFRPSG